MNTRQKLQSKNHPVTIIGHRGASGTAPENTLASIKRACTLGADYIEIDVRLTKDKVPVVLHDAVFKGVLPTQAVRALTYEETQKYDVGVWFSPSYEGERVPTLVEVINACHKKVPLMVEIKREVHGPKTIAFTVFEVLENTRHQWDHLIVGSFCYKILGYTKKMIEASSLPVELIGIADEHRNIEHFLKLGIKRLALSHKLITPELMNDLQKRGVTVWVFTVNTVEKAQELAQTGVHGIISNFPEKVRLA